MVLIYCESLFLRKEINNGFKVYKLSDTLRRKRAFSPTVLFVLCLRDTLITFMKNIFNI